MQTTTNTCTNARDCVCYSYFELSSLLSLSLSYFVESRLMLKKHTLKSLKNHFFKSPHTKHRLSWTKLWVDSIIIITTITFFFGQILHLHALSHKIASIERPRQCGFRTPHFPENPCTIFNNHLRGISHRMYPLFINHCIPIKLLLKLQSVGIRQKLGVPSGLMTYINFNTNIA